MVIPDNNRLKYIMCLTEWHEKYMKNVFPVLENKIKHHYYGIDVNKFNDINEDKIKHRFIYSSTANRGLINILNMWDRILQVLPNASLEVFCDLELQWANNAAPEDMKIIKSKINSKGVIYRGWQTKSELIRGWKRAEYWIYPCIFEETFCLTALEAALSKTIPITNGLAALQETAKYGVIIEGDCRSEEWQDNALEWIKKLENDSTIKDRIIKQNYEFAINSSWFEKTKEFVDKFNILNYDDIIMNKMSTLNYCNMYNWLHDLPKGQNSKEVFKNILMTFKDKRSSILEIGTFAGTSIIGMLNYLEDAKGFTIDKWEDYDENDIYYLKNISKLYIEDIFYENVSKSNMTDRIKSVKGDSSECLIQLIKNNDLFDFIYVDRSHKCIDAYTDCMLSWKLLKEGGVMGIDDYLYVFDNCKELDIPYYGVNHFLEKIEGRYKVLNKGYRLFIVKQEERKNKTWVFYFEKDYNIKMVEQYLNNLKNKYKEYDILLTNDRSDIFKNNCVKITFVFNLHDKLIMDYCKLNNIELGYLNTEPLSSNLIVEIYKEYDKNIDYYDYSESNIKILKENFIIFKNMTYLPYVEDEKEISMLRQLKQEEREIYDFGILKNVIGVNIHRRKKVIDFLLKNNYTVNVIEGWGFERDRELAKCKFVLNIHGEFRNYITTIFEHIRCDRLLQSGYNVLSEESLDLNEEFMKQYNNLKIIRYNDFFDINIIDAILR
jgi:hypothetical protein